MLPYADVLGKRFASLTVVERAGSKRQSATSSVSLWRCICDCGNERVTTAGKLRWGQVRSCGCQSIKHGHTWAGGKSPTYSSWQNMIARCTYPSNPAFAHYQSRGITVCDRWQTFENFLVDMGERPTGLTIERIDNSGNYEPTNCEWASRRTQGNNRSTNIHFVYRGHRYTLAELARETGIEKEILRSRLVRATGWTVEGAVNTPVMHSGPRKGFRA